jgi:HEPN domain-containing protein
MNSQDDVRYKLKLAEGFLKESEEDIRLKRWRSCVDNSQLSAENSAKAILLLFGLPVKTHNPSKQLLILLGIDDISIEIRKKIKEIIPTFKELGFEEHIMTDYGDEETYTLPWDLFDEESASSAINTAKICYQSAFEIVKKTHELRSRNTDK